ncbi:CehA/McbA family metallohydrolase [Halomonas nitroreducens]|uniref:Phosphoesterase n=1 Tax=Halomonas nitroreducens TaxID=447425 RepID=A0A3S0HSS7_9GAMM|nr:CehA/McbA family metallohydrolase [Halomonas nitroreducens]RTR03869.1 phosphoesterase [Halomonas nitroreducens]
MMLTTRRAWLAAGLALGLAGNAQAEVSVTRGATSIPDGEATAAEDLTIANGHLAFALAIESRPPWGVPRGTLVDLAAVKDGEQDLDRVAFADFIPDNWSAWPNSEKSVEVLEDSPERAVVRVRRDWGEAWVTTTYTLEAGSDRIGLETRLENAGEAPLTAIRSGFTLWPDTGFLFGVPGLGEAKESVADEALTDRMVAYDRDWAIALHAPYFDRINYEGQDMYLEHDLAPGASRTFTGSLQVVPKGDLAPVVAHEIERTAQEAGRIAGTLDTDDGEAPEDGLVMVEKQGHPYAWTLAEGGRFAMDLPVGDYRVYATAMGHANSAPRDISVAADGEQSLAFEGLEGPGTLALEVVEAGSGVPRDARLTIVDGQQPPVEFLGKQTFFTVLDPAGSAELSLAPGDYRLAVNAGAGFTAKGETLEVSLASGERVERIVEIERLAEPNGRGWYGADLHHHANVLEGTTPPETVVRAQLATDLDLTFVSDHDSTANHATFQALSDSRGVPFIPSVEISPSWGHMNPFPIALGGELSVDPGTDAVQAILQDARRLGAEVIPMNHPYNDYGYLSNLSSDKVPGGFAPGFDLLELNAEVDNAKTVESAHALWDDGTAIYFTAGTDTHDAWNDLTGRIRMMARVPGELSPRAFARALKQGHGYATQGPLLYPQNALFGDTLRLAGDEQATWRVDVAAVDGLAEARLIGRGGEVVATRELDGQAATLAFPLDAEVDGWVALEVADADGDRAWSNPLWIKRQDSSAYLSAAAD